MGKFNSGGKHSFLRHADSDGHKRVSDGRKGQIPGQRALGATVREDGEDDNGNIQSRRVVGEGEGEATPVPNNNPVVLRRSTMGFNDQVFAPSVRIC